jgi:CRISPR type III-associated protein (TIGR04423 family)
MDHGLLKHNEMKTIHGYFEGYIWMSDASRPIIKYDNEETVLNLDDTVNPFIWEAQLWSKQERRSISIRYVDGKYFIQDVKVDESDQKNSDRVAHKTYMPQRMPKIASLNFLQYWDEKPDPLCENMKTLRPGRLVFIGFTKEK